MYSVYIDCCCWFMQSGQGALSALNPNATASTVMYGTSASSLTSMASGSSEVSFFYLTMLTYMPVYKKTAVTVLWQ